MRLPVWRVLSPLPFSVLPQPGWKTLVSFSCAARVPILGPFRPGVVAKASVGFLASCRTVCLLVLRPRGGGRAAAEGRGGRQPSGPSPLSLSLRLLHCCLCLNQAGVTKWWFSNSVISFTFIGWNYFKNKQILLFQSEWILNCFTLIVCFQTEEVVPWLPAVGTVILLLFLAFSFFFLSLQTWGFLCSLCLSAAVIVAGVQMVPRLARCTFHILIWLQLDYWKCFELWDICCILKTEL